MLDSLYDVISCDVINLKNFRDISSTFLKSQLSPFPNRSKECVTHILEQHYVRELPFPVLMIKNSDLILMRVCLYYSEYCMLSRKNYSKLGNHLLQLKLVNIYLVFKE